MANRARKPSPLQDADSRVPRYLQVASALRRRIRDGRWAVGDRIATLEELECEFDVARVTVRQAIELLQSEGLLKSRQGRGTFVTKTPVHDRWLQLATDWESLIAAIRNHVPEPLPADAGIPPRIEADDGTAAPAYVASRSIQRRDGKPYAYARVHVAKHIHAKAPKAFASRVVLAVLSEMKDVEIVRARQSVMVGAADLDTAQHLGIALNAPTAEVRCVVVDKHGVVIYVGEITFPGDYVRLDIELIP